MSEPISRRTFLKASGLAVLSAAAASALAGCGGGNWTPETALPTLNEDLKEYFTVGETTITINMGSFVKAPSVNGKQYLYTYLEIDNTKNSAEFPVSVSDFTCTIGDKAAAVYSLDTFSAGTAPTQTVQVGMITPKKIPLYIEVSEEQYQNYININVTFRKESSAVRFSYNTAISIYPQIDVLA